MSAERQPETQAAVNESELTITLGSAQEQEAQVEENIGQFFGDKYHVLSRIGRGGMSSVYLARHRFMQKKQVAIKLLHAHLATDAQSIRRFRLEAETASMLSHKGIVGVSDFGILSNGQPYIIMDYVEGVALSAYMKEKKALDFPEFLHLFLQVCDALAYAHVSGVVHRDLKPSNIMLQMIDGKPEIKIVDFGIAKLMHREEANMSELTQTGEIFGSPAYMSPEQCEGRPVDERSDVYSIGCVMFEVLAGRPPFGGNSVYQTIYQQIYDPPPPLKVESEVPADRLAALEITVLKALAKSPDLRHQSMSELLDELKELGDEARSSFGSALSMLWKSIQAKQGTRRSSLWMSPTAISAISLVAVALTGGIGFVGAKLDSYPERIAWSKTASLAVTQMEESLDKFAESTKAELPAFSEEPLEKRLAYFRDRHVDVFETTRILRLSEQKLPERKQELESFAQRYEQWYKECEKVVYSTKRTIFSALATRRPFEDMYAGMRKLLKDSRDVRNRWQDDVLRLYSEAVSWLQLLWVLCTAGLILNLLLAFMVSSRWRFLRLQKAKLIARANQLQQLELSRSQRDNQDSATDN